MGLLDPVAPLFTFSRNLHAVFHCGCMPVHPHSECRRIPFSLRPLQHLFFGDLSNDGCSDRWEGIPQCRFDQH